MATPELKNLGVVNREALRQLTDELKKLRMPKTGLPLVLTTSYILCQFKSPGGILIFSAALVGTNRWSVRCPDGLFNAVVS